jgi:hypothetical protein
MFEDKKTKKSEFYNGRVDKYNIFSKLFFIVYDDGDCEEMNSKELEKVLI